MLSSTRQPIFYPMAVPKDQPEPLEKASMPFLEHLEELRKRLLRAAMAVIGCAILAFYFSDEIMAYIMKPLNGVPLNNMQVAGSFYAYMKVSLIAGLVASLPIVFYQLWSFVAPGLYRREKVTILPLVIISTVLFIVGAAFCYYLALPMALKFLLGFADELITNYITVDSYISFLGFLMLAFGLSFQLPVLAYSLGRFGLITSRTLAKGRRYAIVIILAIAAVVTPTPDIFTQLLLAVPMYCLYEVSIFVVKISGRREQPAA
ncbi:MAG: twin-arginine translocase subunit TatC [Candidatus Zixiibacteriota bacterium]